MPHIVGAIDGGGQNDVHLIFASGHYFDVNGRVGAKDRHGHDVSEEMLGVDSGIGAKHLYQYAAMVRTHDAAAGEWRRNCRR